MPSMLTAGFGGQRVWLTRAPPGPGPQAGATGDSRTSSLGLGWDGHLELGQRS